MAADKLLSIPHRRLVEAPCRFRIPPPTVKIAQQRHGAGKAICERPIIRCIADKSAFNLEHPLEPIARYIQSIAPLIEDS
jgi:hypothetical protein